MARVAVGVTGSIAAYKAAEVIRLLVRDGHEVVPLVTPGAERFVTSETFRALARVKPEVAADPYPHLTSLDLLVIAPLSANTLAKLAHGLADTLVTEAALAHDGPVLVAPAMNARMWRHSATQANADTLRSRGIEFIGPETGELAEGEWGEGRMAEPEQIAARCEELLREPDLRGKRVLVTAGGTREPLDSVRFLGNRSSGRMGVALAEQARRRGADVTLVASNLAVPTPAGIEVVEAPSAADLARETLARGDADVVLMAAAVADYRPTEETAGKRPRADGAWTLELESTEDILRDLSERRSNEQLLVGFAAEHGAEAIERARAKLAAKGVDLLVFNDVSRGDIGFDADDNEVTLLSAAGEQTIPKGSKNAVAGAILDQVVTLLGRSGQPSA